MATDWQLVTACLVLLPSALEFAHISAILVVFHLMSTYFWDYSNSQLADDKESLKVA